MLGSGTSVGIPSIGCHCRVCTSTDPRDRRLRPSILLRYNDRNVLIDSGPDFRRQALRAKLDRLDAILYTHAHADHILGLDDVRPFNFRQKQAIPIYGSAETIATIRQVFRYVFETEHSESTLPRVESHELDGQPFDLFGLTITPVPVRHGRGVVFGYRFGSAAYLTDHGPLPESAKNLLRGLDILFLDGLRHREHPTHSTVAQSLDAFRDLAPHRAFLTHICHDLMHAEEDAKLPPRVALAQDGLQLETTARSPIRVFRDLGETAFFGPSAVTIGNFDGVHRGHRELMRLVASHAVERALIPGAVTFDPHPAKVVAPQRAPRLLTTIERRMALMAEEGIRHAMVLAFTREIAQLTPEQFVERILAGRLGVRHIVVGDDFRFGAQQAGDVSLLQSLGRRLDFTVEAIRKIDSHHQYISSTAIRKSLDRGDVSEAGHALGRPYSLEGEVVSGHGIGAKQTVPTLNLAWTAEIVPSRGVYVTRTHDVLSARSWQSVTNIGFRPTFQGDSLTIETFLLDARGSFAPRTIRVDFLYRLRDERKFESPEELKAQILRDVARAKTYFRRVARWVR